MTSILKLSKANIVKYCDLLNGRPNLRENVIDLDDSSLPPVLYASSDPIEIWLGSKTFSKSYLNDEFSLSNLKKVECCFPIISNEDVVTSMCNLKFTKMEEFEYHLAKQHSIKLNLYSDPDPNRNNSDHKSVSDSERDGNGNKMAKKQRKRKTTIPNHHRQASANKNKSIDRERNEQKMVDKDIQSEKKKQRKRHHKRRASANKSIDRERNDIQNDIQSDEHKHMDIDNDDHMDDNEDHRFQDAEALWQDSRGQKAFHRGCASGRWSYGQRAMLGYDLLKNIPNAPCTTGGLRKLAYFIAPFDVHYLHSKSVDKYKELRSADMPLNFSAKWIQAKEHKSGINSNKNINVVDLLSDCEELLFPEERVRLTFAIEWQFSHITNNFPSNIEWSFIDSYFKKSLTFWKKVKAKKVTKDYEESIVLMWRRVHDSIYRKEDEDGDEIVSTIYHIHE